MAAGQEGPRARSWAAISVDRATFLAMERLELLEASRHRGTFALAAVSALTQADELFVVREGHALGALAWGCDSRRSAYVGSGTLNCLRG